MIAIVAPDAAGAVVARLAADGIPAWQAGVVSTSPRDASAGSAPAWDGWQQGAKGVTGGAVRLTGAYRA